MPEGKRIDVLMRSIPITDSNTAKLVFPAGSMFDPLQQWLRADATKVYGQWLFTHPGYLLSEPFQQPTQAYNFANGNLTFYAATVKSLESPVTRILWPSLSWLAGLSVLAGILGIWKKQWRQRPWRVVLCLTLLGPVAMLIAWHGDAQEVTRHTVEGFAELRLGVWILVVLGALSGATRESAAKGFESGGDLAHWIIPLLGGSPRPARAVGRSQGRRAESSVEESLAPTGKVPKREGGRARGGSSGSAEGL